MDSGLPLRPKQLGRGQVQPESLGAGPGDTQPGDYDTARKPAEEEGGHEGGPSAQDTHEDRKSAGNIGRQGTNQRSSVKVIINKNNSQTAQQRTQHATLQAARQRLDIGDMINSMGVDTRGSAGQFDFAGAVLSDGCLSPASLTAEMPPRKAVRLKGSLGRGSQQAQGDHEAPSLGVSRYAKAPPGFQPAYQTIANADLHRALKISPQGASLDVSHL